MLITSCKTSQTAIDSKDLSYLYNPTKNSIKPRFSVLNETDESVGPFRQVFYIRALLLRSKSTGYSNSTDADNVKLYDISRGRTLADTANYQLSIVKEEGKTRICLQDTP